MFGVLGFLAFVVFQGAYAQECFPDAPGNLTLELNYTLHWTPSTKCERPGYLIYVHIEENLQYIYSTYDTHLDVSELPACERFSFECNAFIENALSEPALLVSYIPAPSGADLTITSFKASVQQNATFLNWEVTPHFAHCARAFRLVVRDDYSPLPTDIYTERNHFFLTNLIPCAKYNFGVTAIYNLEEEGPINQIDYEAPQDKPSRPTLLSVETKDSWASMTWGLDTYSQNRCNIKSLVVDGLPVLHETFVIDDTPERLPFKTNLTSLTSDNMFILKVSVINSAGISDDYTIGVQTQPAENV